jgi:hypothetical protein
MVKLKSSRRHCYHRHDDLVNRDGIYVSHMKTYMFHWSYSHSCPFLIHDLSPGLQQGLVPLVEQDLPTFLEHLGLSQSF